MDKEKKKTEVYFNGNVETVEAEHPVNDVINELSAWLDGLDSHVNTIKENNSHDAISSFLISGACLLLVRHLLVVIDSKFKEGEIKSKTDITREKAAEILNNTMQQIFTPTIDNFLELL